MSTFIADVRFAARSLSKHPGLTLAAVLSLGLGIGANTTIFSWIEAALVRPVPGAADPGRLVVAAMESRTGQNRSWSYPNYKDFHDRSKLVELVAQDDQTMNIAVDGSGERTWGGLVSGNYFQVMGVAPAVGRLIAPADDLTPGGHPVVVLSHAYWQRRFAGDPAIVGREVTVNNTPLTVIGVAPEGFMGSFLGVAVSAWAPMAMQRELTGGNRLDARGNGWMQVLGRVAPGASRPQAQAEANAVMAQLAQEFPATNEGRRVKLVSTWEAPFGAPSVLAPVLGVMSVLVALVLLVACANVANLLLSKAVGRRREIAVRVSLGASRWRLVRQLLTEAMLLAAAAGILGLLMARWTMGVIMAFVPPVDLPIDLGLRMDGSTLLFALGVSVTTGVVFGLAPALQASNPEAIQAIKEEGGRGSSGRTGQRLRSVLVTAQVAVCLVLLIGAGLFLRSFQAAQALDPGFEAERLATVSVDLGPSGYSGARSYDFERRLGERLGALPGVEGVAFTNRLPMGFGGNSSLGLEVVGYVPQPNEEVVINYTIAGAGYFRVMGIPMREGREFDDTDTQDSAAVIVINETMAKRYWPNGGALGGRVRFGQRDIQVVGIAADAKYAAINERPLAQIYLPLGQNNISTVRTLVRASGDPAALMPAIRDVFRDLDPAMPVYDARTVREHMQTAVFAQRLAANLLGAMGVLALVLAAIGLYGVMSYAVGQRLPELGIRVALGASPATLLAMVVRQGMTLVAIGLVVGTAMAGAAFGSAGAVRRLLPGISPLDPMTFIAVPVGLALVALVAAVIPARRAGKVDPIVVLREG